MASDERHSVKFEVTDDGTDAGVEKEDVGSDIADPFDPNDIDILTRAFTVGQVVERIEYNEIVLTPDFQRAAGIWKLREKSRLIESLLLRIPLPMFYVSTDRDEHWVVVDGLQRLTTIRDFVGNKFALSDLEFLKTFEDSKFDDLPRPMQRRIRESELTLHMIQPSTPPAVTRTIFRRINTGGLPLSAQEIRHALYQGPSTLLLRDLVKEPAFLTATTNSLSDSRMAGRECALRFLAFYKTPFEQYRKKDLDGFLSETMQKINELDPTEIIELRQAFVRSMERCTIIFGEKAFRKQFTSDGNWRYPINKALFETWSVCLAQLNETSFSALSAKRDLLNSQFCLLMKRMLPLPSTGNMSFEYAVSQDTSDPSKVRCRFGAVRELIESILRSEVW